MNAGEGRWEVARQLPAAHPSLAGHFPGQPVLPGVVLLAEVLEAAAGVAPLAAWLGRAPRIDNVKFLAPLVPRQGRDLAVTIVLVRRPAGLDFELRAGDTVAARGQLAPGA